MKNEILDKITPELIEELFVNFYHGDWVQNTGDYIDLIRTADLLKEKLK
jgi:hypothetical protein